MSSKGAIFVGSRSHISGCCDGAEKRTEPTNYTYVPRPDPRWIKHAAPYSVKAVPTGDEAIRGCLTNGEYIKGRTSKLDTVAT
ncbi:MAG: hypothetical protein GY772_27865, partial [bacterium]|nr:hypothetical protein [bacterium]